MYGNQYYNPQRYQNIGMPMVGTQTNQYMQSVAPTQIPITSPMALPASLLGKVVDSIEVVKATDIPLDGSTSYFPLTDGSAIITKKLQSDGTSRTIIYKPLEEERPKEQNKMNFVSLEDFLDLKSDFDDLRDALNKLKEENKQLKEASKKKENR